MMDYPRSIGFNAMRERFLCCVSTERRVTFFLFPSISASPHGQYIDWAISVARCDETEQRGGEHWAGGCPFLEYGGYSWHLR